MGYPCVFIGSFTIEGSREVSKVHFVWSEIKIPPIACFFFLYRRKKMDWPLIFIHLQPETLAMD